MIAWNFHVVTAVNAAQFEQFNSIQKYYQKFRKHLFHERLLYVQEQIGGSRENNICESLLKCRKYEQEQKRLYFSRTEITSRGSKYLFTVDDLRNFCTIILSETPGTTYYVKQSVSPITLQVNRNNGCHQLQISCFITETTYKSLACRALLECILAVLLVCHCLRFGRVVDLR
jgi:hypothetical protein